MPLLPGDLAIDVGSVNSLATNDGVNIKRVPSLVARYRTGKQKVVAVGIDAKAYVGHCPSYIEVVSPVEEGRISDEEAFVALVQYLVQTIYPGYGKWKLGRRPTALIAVPMTTKTEYKGWKELIEKEIAINALMVPQPGAAVFGAKISGTNLAYKDTPTCSIIDIGGTTTDIGALSNSMPCWLSSLAIGGNFFDTAIKLQVLRKKHLIITLSTARKVKELIGSLQPFPDGPKSADVYGIPLSNGIEHTGKVELTDAEVREWLQEPAMTMCSMLNTELGKITQPDVYGEMVERGLMVTGGGGQLHGLSETLKKNTGRKFTLVDEPLDSVIHGAVAIMGDKELRKLFNLIDHP